MFSWLTKALWGGPVRRVVTVATPLAILPFWNVNVEAFLHARGLDQFLVNGGPVADAAGWLVAAVSSPEFQWAVLGAFTVLLVDGWLRYRGSSGYRTDLMYDAVARGYQAALTALNDGPRGHSEVMGEIESAYHWLRKAKIPVPERGKDYKDHSLKAYYFLGAMKPLIRDGHLDRSRELAEELIASTKTGIDAEQEATGEPSA